MNKIKYFFILAAFWGFSVQLAAQNFNSAIGVRFGYPFSISYKTFISESHALEGYVGFRGYSGVANWISINGAYQIHSDIDAIDGLEWYYGAGAGAQFWSYDFAESGSTTFSVSGYLGLQYTFEEAPVSVSIDWVPTFFIGDSRYGAFNSFGGGYGALAARYTLGRQ
ncbi:hypothetical protein GGR28_002902 [Lewinella aquimaris]|uniref:Outer membrane protein beta-barrel domain-containing protein n=1 Tax=Neolewinella aquimaris TaxID=1835722 RepID=A0A840E973_9BACT|nr:hypothetical protein [Neolewinella aquimaris]MBB4080272.1 hypothetical protein [Neolewinella aquimaris]